MNLDREFGVDVKKAAAIADYFREACSAYETDKLSLAPLLMGGYQKQFGDLNFGLLEAIFRQENLDIHFLALPGSLVAPKLSNLVVVDINKKLQGRYVEKPFAAIAYSSKKEAIVAASAIGIGYESKQNLLNLKQAGAIVTRTGFPQFVDGDPRMN